MTCHVSLNNHELRVIDTITTTKYHSLPATIASHVIGVARLNIDGMTPQQRLLTVISNRRRHVVAQIDSRFGRCIMLFISKPILGEDDLEVSLRNVYTCCILMWKIG
ncbi:hypothetical protein CDAR_72541 [Caerostris darwini]|uniref:Uncharacterized protein n=1 Tax=Caerostris darwini TaxID=1538125 RepID=A0AAV4MJZ4_9ARAC|nr:hypothetical protein CDAR_72541 [Caerostris darwini]